MSINTESVNNSAYAVPVTPSGQTAPVQATQDSTNTVRPNTQVDKTDKSVDQKQLQQRITERNAEDSEKSNNLQKTLAQQLKKTATSSDPEVLTEQVKEAIKNINEYIKSFQRSLSFTIDEESETPIIKVLDESDGTVVRQLPSENLLEIAQHLSEAQGLLFNDKA